MNQGQKTNPEGTALEKESSVTIAVNSVKEIFSDPEPENLPPLMRSQSGLDELEAILKSQYPKLKTGSVTFLISQKQKIEAGLLVSAIRSYCLDKSKNFKRNIYNTKRWSRTVLRFSLFELLALVIISVFVLALIQTIPVLVSIVTAFFVIGAWVFLWGPIELRFYDWLEDKRDEDIYKHIGGMDIKIRQL